MKTYATIVGAGILISGCASKPVITSETLADQWSSRLRGYHILPVFPPREDVQVGDIYAMCSVKPKEEGSDTSNSTLSPNKAEVARPEAIATWLTRIPEMRGALVASYEATVSLPPVTAPPKGTPQDPTQDLAPLPESQSFLMGKGNTHRLRNVSLPEFFSATVNNTEVGALIPAGVILAGMGFSSEDVGSVSVSVPSAGSYGLPAWTAIQTARSSKVWSDTDFWKWATTYLNQEYKQNCESDETPVFVLVTEAIAAYSLDVNLTFTKGSAAKLQAAMVEPADSTRKATLDALLQYFATTGGSGKSSGGSGDKPASGDAATPTTPKTPSLPTEELIAQLKELLASATGREQQQFPGITAQVTTGSNSGIRVHRKFANPVVIGYRAVAFNPTDHGSAPTTAIFANVRHDLMMMKTNLPLK